MAYFSPHATFCPTCVSLFASSPTLLSAVTLRGSYDTGSVRRLAKRLERDRDYLEQQLGLPTDDAEEVRVVNSAARPRT